MLLVCSCLQFSPLNFKKHRFYVVFGSVSLFYVMHDNAENLGTLIIAHLLLGMLQDIKNKPSALFRFQVATNFNSAGTFGHEFFHFFHNFRERCIANRCSFHVADIDRPRVQTREPILNSLKLIEPGNIYVRRL